MNTVTKTMKMTLAALLLVSPCGLASVMLYEETFGDTGVQVDNQWHALERAQWRGNVGHNFESVSVDSDPYAYDGANRLGIFPQQNHTSINRFLVHQKGSGDAEVDAIAYTTTLRFQDGLTMGTELLVADYSSLQASWDANQTSKGSAFALHFVIQVGGDWYASQVASEITAVGGSSVQSMSHSLLDANWYRVSNESAGLRVETETLFADLLTSEGAEISGVGFYYQDLASSGTIRIDNLRIHGELIPEVSSAALSVFGALVVLRRRRRDA